MAKKSVDGKIDGLVEVTSVKIDAGTQSRVRIDQETVDEYAAIYQAAKDAKQKHPCDALPPLDVCHDGVTDVLWDGFHRLLAALKAGLTHVRVRRQGGTAADAQWLASGANLTHGLKRNNADKQKAAEMALIAHPDASDNAVAGHCSVGHDMVAAARKRLVKAGQLADSARRTGSDGRTRNVTNIGKGSTSGKKPPPPAEEPYSPEEQQQAGENLIKQARADAERQNPPKNGAHGKKQPEAPQEVRDALAQVVPPRLRDVFADLSIVELLDRLRATKESLQHAATVRRLEGLAPYHKWLNLPLASDFANEAQANLTALCEHLANAQPYALCPHCLETAGGCEKCRGAGYVPAWRHDELEQQAKLEGGR